MSALQVERYSRSRRRGVGLGCGCGLVALMCGVVACVWGYMFSSTPLLTAIGLEIAGAQRIGRTDDLFETVNTTENTSTIPQGRSTAGRVTVSLGAYGQQTLDTSPQTVTITTSADNAQVTFSESGLVALCDQRGNTCTEGDSRYRNISVDLRPGGAVVNAEVNAGVWQRIGVVVRLNAIGTRFEVLGVDVGGVLYDPETLPGETATFVREVARVGNDALRQLVVNIGGRGYNLETILIDETQLLLVLR